MPSKSPYFQLEYFKQGSYYSSASDLRRFVTLDYNMDSYIGVIGVGIISGWTIEEISGLIVKILPGKGIINGYFAESPYTVKQRSAMVAGDREIEVLNENDITELPLTPIQRAVYVSIIQLYNPSFNPVGPIENSYVKVVVPYQISLSNNTDTYIYARRPNSATPYPLLSDYPPAAGNPPVRSNYSTYDAYLVALNVYNAKLTAIHNYQWYTNPANHFTAVEFITSGSFINTSNMILLGRVVTRSLSVSKIDISQVNNLANFESQIKQFATEFLVEHKHGGNLPFDPPKVRLETDIRDTVLYNYDSGSGQTIYNVLDRKETTITLGHKHTYQIDSDGDGQTMEQIGSTNSHIHKISSFVVGTSEYTVNSIESHIHVIKNQSSADTWSSSSPFVIYVNDEIFGDETTPYIHADSTNKKIVFDKGVSASNNKYSCSFTVTLLNPLSEDSEKKNYSYEARDVSIYHFMLSMMNDYNQTFAQYYSEQAVLDYGAEGVTQEILQSTGGETTVSNIRIIYENLKNSPFLFYSSDGSLLYGLQDLQFQSSAAQVLMTKIGDHFTFTPNAARNITVTLAELGHIDDVQIEILGNTEVTGKLKAENVLYLNANKILTGEFIVRVIPFISHAGRLREECLPLQYRLISNDGIRYAVVPTITDVSLGHYHNLLVDKDVTGVTTDVMVANDVVYYENDSNNNTHFIYHAHNSQEGSIGSAESSGLLNWQNNVSSSTLTSSSHTHNVIYSVIGNEKTIYAIKEDIEGNIYVGTSDGFIIIPSQPAYQFVINGISIYLYGNNLWTLLEKAKMQYEKETGNPFTITESVYKSQIDNAILVLLKDGDSVLLTGSVYPDRPIDQIMIKRISSFLMPDFKYIETKDESEVLETETVIENIPANTTNGTLSQVVVERDFNDVPIWSIELNTVIDAAQNYISPNVFTDVLVTGSNIVAKAVGLNKTPYQTWNSIDFPFFIGVMRKTIKDPDGNYWVCTNNGIMVSRYYSEGNKFEVVSLPAGNPDIQDILNGERDAIYCVSSYGIFKTINGGKSWNKLFDVIGGGGFKQLARDRTLDKTDVVGGHYHMFDVNNAGDGFLGESIGSGTKHVHVVKAWNVLNTMGHIHTMVVTLYALDNSKIIWKSIDNGLTWKEYGLLPDGECGEIFAAFGKLFTSQYNGLYSSLNGNSWSKVLDKRAYSYEWSYDMSELFIGSNNHLYGTFDGISFVSVFSFSGIPYAIIMYNQSKQYYGYAYSNFSQTFHFKNLILDSEELTSLVDFEKWYAQEGGWDNNIPYDVYINYKRVLSTKYNDNKQDIYGHYFSVVPLEGKLDFSASTIATKSIDIYDNVIETSNAYGFTSGDTIIVMSNNSSFHTVIENIDVNDIMVTSRITEEMELPVSIKKIPDLDGSSNILMNIYNSLLSNIGVLTHDQIEDGLSNYSDGRPYKFNDTYLSNLLQLTQGVRYVYPDINSKFINDMFYDFRYSWNPLSPYSIYKYIDVVTSEAYNQKVYDNSFVEKLAKSINKILIGFGSFSGIIFVATDIGIFFSKLTPSYEANWFYVKDISFPVYDLMIFGSNLLLAATSEGTYYTEDMIHWNLYTTPAIYYPSYSLGLRWFDKATVLVSSHTATFTPGTGNTGTITTSSTLYNQFKVGQGIKVTGAGEKNGGYIIQSIGNAGAGFGSKMVVSPSFSGTTATKSNVVITMGTWWGQWNGDVNISNPSLTNTLLVGGQDHISYNDGGAVGSWHESSFSDASNFISRKFYSLSNGRLLLSATGTSATNLKNYLLKSDDIGKTWNVFKSFSEIKGNILSSSISDFNHTVLKVSYTQPKGFIYVNGILDQQDIAVFPPNSNIALFRGKVIWNEKRDSIDTIMVFGNTLYSLVGSHTDYIFTIYPSKINTMYESLNDTIFFGTDKGLYSDVNTVVSNRYPEGTIANAGYNGVVQKIDISGTIISIGTNVVTGNSVLSVESDTVIRSEDLIGKFFYVTDADPVEKYDIVVNDSLSPGNESQIEINTKGLSSTYIGKKFRILGSSSRIYINFDLPVYNNQFNNGSMYIFSNEYKNRGKKYTVVSNGTNYVDLNTALIPSTTLVNRIGESIPVSTISALQVGQSVRLIDSSNKLTLWVTLDRYVKENSLKDLVFSLTDLPSTRLVTDATIISNLKNSITIDTNGVLNYLDGDTFVIKGAMFEQAGGFSHLITSTESSHYHNVETVNSIVSGDIQSFSNVGSSYVDIVVTDTENFNIPIVQLQGDLFEDAQIVFTTPQNINLRYISEVISHTSTSIKVRIKFSSYWNFISSDPFKISSGWRWEIDGTNYGYTNGIQYDDFAALFTGVTDTAHRGDLTIKVLNSTGMNIGDKIRIQDDTLSYEINYIQNVVDINTITLQTSLDRTYFISRNPQIKVLRDTFANTHVHQIRNNEVQNLLIESYLDNGYSSEHSHRVLPLISDISVLLNQDDDILALGSSSIIYGSNNNGETWTEIVDLNNYLEGTDEVDGVSSAILNHGDLVVGATNGNLFVQTETSGEIIPLNNPL